MDYKDIQALIKGFETSNITQLELETGSVKLKLNKEVVVANHVMEAASVTSAPRNVQVVTQPAQPVVEEPIGEPVRSPLVGTFYAASSPQDEPFVKVGQTVKAGDTVCIIEAMKIMNEITAPVAGTVASIDVKNGDVVSFDQVILTIV